MIFELVKDFAAVLKEMPQEHAHHKHMELLSEAVRRDLSFIDRHPTTLFQCMWNSCWWYDCLQLNDHLCPFGAEPPVPAVRNSEPGPISVLLEAWLVAITHEGLKRPWLKSLRPPMLALGEGLEALLQGHTVGNVCVSYSPDGVFIASGGADGTVRIWDSITGFPVSVLTGHEAGVRCVAWSPDSRRLVSGSYDRTLRVWDVTTASMLQLLIGHSEWIMDVAWSPTEARIASVSLDRCLMVWHSDSGKLLDEWSRGQVPVSVCYSPDGRRIGVASWSEGVSILCAKSLDEVTWLLHKDTSSQSTTNMQSIAYCLRFHPGGKLIVAGCSCGRFKIWDVEGHSHITLIGDHTGENSEDWLAYLRVCVSSDGSRIYGGSQDGDVRIWDSRNGQLLAVLTGQETPVSGMCLDKDSQWIAIGLADGTIRIRRSGFSESKHEVVNHSRKVTCIDVSKDGGSIVTGGDHLDNTVRLWCGELGVLRDTYTRSARRNADCQSGVTDVCYAPCGRWFVSVASDSQFTSHYGKTSQSTPVNGVASHKTFGTEMQQTEVKCVTVDPSSSMIACGLSENTVCLIHVSTGVVRERFGGHNDRVTSIAYSDCGAAIATGDGSGTVRVWTRIPVSESWLSRLWQRIRTIEGYRVSTVRVWSRFPTAESWLPSNETWLRRVWLYFRFIVGLRRRPWDWTAVFEYSAHRRAVTGIAFSADGGKIVSSSSDRTVSICDVAERQQVANLNGLGDASEVARSIGYRALASSIETAIESVESNAVIAWHAARFEIICAHPNGRAWVASVGRHLHLIELSGAHFPVAHCPSG